MDLIFPSFYTHTNVEENALTFINFHLFDRKNNALAGHSAAHTQTETRNCCKVNRLSKLRSRKPPLLFTFVSLGVRALRRPPLGLFKSEVHPKLQRFAPPRDGD